MANDSNRPDVAVFIDFENVYVSVRDKLDANPNFESIMDRCEDLGRVVIARAYADWYRYPRITSALYANGIEPMYVPTYYYDRDLGRTGRAIKNSVDMNLCVEAMRTLFTNPNIAKFVLATGDRDFIPLVNSIRQQGKEVIVIGIGGAASAHLAQSADEFIFYESLIGKSTPQQLLPDQPRAKMPEKGRENEPDESADAPRERERERPERSRDRERPAERIAERPAERIAERPAERIAERPTERITERLPERPAEREREAERSGEPDIYEVLVQAVKLARERGYVCSFGSLKLLMKELMGGEFKEGRYKDVQGRPFAKFKDFVMEGERRGKVQVFTNGTVNEVLLPGENPYEVSQFARDLQEEAASVPAVLETPVAESRADGRAGLSSGRRRRRRPRGGRQNGQQPDDALSEETLETDLDDAPDMLLVEPNDADDALTAAELGDEGETDALFESLLDQVEQEQAETDAISTFNALDFDQPGLIDEPQPEAAPDAVDADATSPAAPLIEPVAMSFDGSDSATTSATIEPVVLIGRPFDEDDWLALREVAARFERPASFAQLHDALRDARNRHELERTNEELRTLVKQAINSGMLERVGKGNRIAYRLAPQTAVGDEPNDPAATLTDGYAEVEPSGDEHIASVAEMDDEAPADEPLALLADEAPTDEVPTDEAPFDDQIAQIADDQIALIADEAPTDDQNVPLVDADRAETDDQTAQIVQAPQPDDEPQADQTTFDAEQGATDAEQAETDDQTAQIVQAPQPDDEPQADQTTLIESSGNGQVEFATPDAPVEQDTVPEAEAPTEEPTKPKRQRRRKETPVAEAAPEASAPAEEPAKPKRRPRRPKTETTETQE